MCFLNTRAGREWRVRAEWLREPWRLGRWGEGSGRARSDTARGRWARAGTPWTVCALR